MNDARSVFTSSRRDEAEAVAELLAAQGVSTRVIPILGDDLMAAVGAGKPLPSAGFDVLVPSRQQKMAKRLLTRFAAWRDERSGDSPEAIDEEAEEFLEEKAVLEVCPECGRARTTACPWCGTAGAVFAAAYQPPAAQPAPRLLMCPQCDEPFAPRYLRLCEWCDHSFDDGVDALESNSSQAIDLFQGAAGALASTAIGVALFLLLLAALNL